MWGWLKKAVKVVTKVAEIASYIPGPIGMVASGVAVAGNLAQGNYKAAAEAALGLIPGGKLLATAAKAAVAVKAVKAVQSVKKAGAALRTGAKAVKRTATAAVSKGASAVVAGAHTVVRGVSKGATAVASKARTVLNKNNFFRPLNGRVSFGAAPNYWDKLPAWRKVLQPVSAHFERAKGGITWNPTRSSVRLWGNWK